MSPIIPTSLLARSFCGTLRKTPSGCGCVPRASVTKTYFTPNRLRGGTHRPFVHHTFHPSLCHCPPPPTIPRPQYRSSAGRKHSRDGFHHIPLYIIKLGTWGALLSITFLAAPIIYCDSTSKSASPVNVPPSKPQVQVTPPSLPPPPPPQSSVNLYELTFGTVCGVCAGVFVKKGARLVAFAFGGVFVLLQYLGSLSIVRVDWNRAGSRFENLFYTKDALGVSRPPNVASLFRWLFDFLTADFQPRASFIAGFALGLRVG